MKRLSLALVVIGLAACGGSHDWPQSLKDTMTGSCFKEAKNAGSQLADAKITAYCLCYQRNVQKQFPDAADLQKAAADVLSKAAEPCLEEALK